MRQGAKQRRVNDAEDCEIDADAEREHGSDGRCRATVQPPHGITEILQRFVHKALPACSAELFPEGFCVSKLESRAAGGFGRGHAAPHEVLCIRVDVEPEFFGRTVLETLAAKCDEKCGAERMKEAHFIPPCRRVRRTWPCSADSYRG